MKIAEDRWRLAPGEPLLPGLLAWTQLGDGVRRETWLAWSARHWTAVAVKLPRPGLVGDPRVRATLRREAELMRRVCHPAFQRLLHDGSADPVPHLVLEYVEGPSLDMVLDDGTLGPADLVLLGMHLGAALHYLHGAGLVHRDLKPENLVLRDGRPVVLDLGLAQPIDTPGRAQGTDGYIAPEQERGEAAAPAIDLFATGKVLIEAATGDIDGDTSGLPAGLVELLRRLVDPDAATRPPCAAALMIELRALLPEDGETPWPAWLDGTVPAPHTGAD
jgi:eukaryotic-like serine/threonine-protein kinase